MEGLIKSEWVKGKRSFQKKLIVIAPIMAILISFLLMGKEDFQNFTYNTWYILLEPAALTIISTAIISKDKKKNFHGLFSEVESKEKFWVSKIIIGIIYFGIMNLILFLGCAVIGVILGKTSLIFSGMVASILLFILFIWQIPMWMYLGNKINNGLVLLISLFLNVGIAIFCAIKWFWWIPFSIPARVMCAVIKVLPNGLQVDKGSNLLDRSVIGIGLIITVLLFIIVTYVTARIFNKEED